MLEFVAQVTPAEPWLGLDWKVVGIGVTLLTTIMGSMLGLVYKLIASNFAARSDLSDQKVESVKNDFTAMISKNDAVDTERMKQITHDVKANRRHVESMYSDFRDLVERLPIEYVHKDDWTRGFSQLDGKIDRFAQKTDARLEAIYELVANTRETVARKGK